jgi:23S rRNA pseudouridine2605 synthase
LAQRLTHPRYGIEKTYWVQVAGQPAADELQRLRKGVWTSAGLCRAKHAKRLGKQGNSTWLLIVLAEGKNRQVRRMLAKLGHKVMSLKRVALGPIRLSRLKRGKARRLSLEEVRMLRKLAFPPQPAEAPR